MQVPWGPEYRDREMMLTAGCVSMWNLFHKGHLQTTNLKQEELHWKLKGFPSSTAGWISMSHIVLWFFGINALSLELCVVLMKIWANSEGNTMHSWQRTARCWYCIFCVLVFFLGKEEKNYFWGLINVWPMSEKTEKKNCLYHLNFWQKARFSSCNKCLLI